MIDNAVEMAARLHELTPHGLQVTYCQFEGENHVSVIPALVSRALRFAMATRDDNREK
jgi:predicted alpha/beta superfamily hydrolase